MKDARLTFQGSLICRGKIGAALSACPSRVGNKENNHRKGITFSSAKRRAFSLVEVTMALGLVSFAMLGILGLLPVGLKTVQDAVVQSAEANIARQVRADLQQISLGSLTTFSQGTKYYSQQGFEVPSKSDAFFIAEFDTSNPTIAGAPDSFETNAQIVKVTLKYPAAAAEDVQKSKTFSLLTACQ